MVNVYRAADPGNDIRDRLGAAVAVADKHAADVDESGRFPVEAVRELGRQGLLGLTVPTGAGGLGRGPREFVAAAEELAQACASTAMIYVMHVCATAAIAQSTTLDGRDGVLAEIAAGDHLTTLALSEKGSRSMFWLPVSRLEERGGTLVVTAHKSWVTSAGHASSYVSGSRRPGASSATESTLYLVRSDRPEVSVCGGFNGLGLRGNGSVPVSIQECPVPTGDLLCEQGAGLDSLMAVVLPWFALGTSAMANGLCLATTAATAAHLSRTGFDTGGGLRDLPNLRARLAEMSVRTEQSRALLGHALDHVEAPSDGTALAVLRARLSALQAAWDVTDLAMRACGGAAFSRQLPIERLFRDARAGWVMAPTADHLHDFIGRALTGLPLVPDPGHGAPAT